MPENIVTFPKAYRKTIRRLSASVLVHDGQNVIREELSPAEREVLKFSIADQAAIILRQHSDISFGHKAAMAAHLVALKQRHGDRYAADVLSLLAGMLGCEVRFHDIPYADPQAPKDLSDIELS